MEPSDLRALVAANIRRWAKKRRLSLNMVADTAGIARSPFFRALNGEASFTLDRLCKIAVALGCRPRDLFDER